MVKTHAELCVDSVASSRKSDQKSDVHRSKFGGRDHTTVIHAVKKVEELRSMDSGFAEDVELLRRMLEG